MGCVDNEASKMELRVNKSHRIVVKFKVFNMKGFNDLYECLVSKPSEKNEKFEIIRPSEKENMAMFCKGEIKESGVAKVKFDYVCDDYKYEEFIGIINNAFRIESENIHLEYMSITKIGVTHE